MSFYRTANPRNFRSSFYRGDKGGVILPSADIRLVAAELGLPNNSDISSWGNLSKTDGTLTYNSSGANGKPSVDFFAAALVDSSSRFDYPQPNHFFFVASMTNALSNRGYFFDSDLPTTRNAFGYALSDPNASKLGIFSGSTVIESSVSDSDIANLALYELVFDGSNTEVHRNRSLLISGNSGSDSFNGIRLGKNVFGSGQLTGTIAFFLCKNGSFSTSDRNTILQFASDEYGL